MCKGGQVEIGDPKGEVLYKCGEPLSKDVIGQKEDHVAAGVPGGAVGKEEHETVEEWVYIDIPYHYNRYVIMTFRGGKLERIDEKAK